MITVETNNCSTKDSVRNPAYIPVSTLLSKMAANNHNIG